MLARSISDLTPSGWKFWQTLIGHKLPLAVGFRSLALGLRLGTSFTQSATQDITQHWRKILVL